MKERVTNFAKNLKVDIKQAGQGGASPTPSFQPVGTSNESPKPSLYLLEYDEKSESAFRQNDATEYFRTIFRDVAARSLTPRTEDHPKYFIDNVAFFEWTKLPGIICDRFF